MNYYLVFWRPEGETDPHVLYTLNEDDANWLEALLKEQPEIGGALRMEMKTDTQQSTWSKLWNNQKRPDGPVN